MDNQEAKILVLEKIFYDKIFELHEKCVLMHGESEEVIKYNLYCNSPKNSESDHLTIMYSIFDDKISQQILVIHSARNPHRRGQFDEFVPVENEFKTIKQTIDFVVKNFSLNSNIGLRFKFRQTN